jgi:hypothetical protein
MPTLTDACGVIGRIFSNDYGYSLFISSNTDAFLCAMGITLLFIKDFCAEYYPNLHLFINGKYRWLRWSSYICLMIIILLTGVFGADQFIYANF